MTISLLQTPDLSLDGDPESSRRIIRESLALMRAHLGMDVAFVGRFSDNRRWFEYVDAEATFCPIRPGQSDPLETTFCARVADGRIPELITDTADVPELESLDATRGLPVGSHMSVAMRAEDGQAFGTLCCFSRAADSGLRERDLDVLRMFADLIGTHMEFLVRHEQTTRPVRAAIRRVLDDGGPRMALQPIVDILAGRTYGYEALARFPDCDWTPDRWFNDAEPLGLGPALEASAVRAAIALVPALPADIVLSVNVSAHALFEDPDIATMFAGEHASRLVLELTEHARVSDYGRLEARLEPVRAAGARIAVDDAGSGYAGLEHILQLRPEVLKLDRALVQGVAEHPGRQAMCQAMVVFARSTGTMLVAEGIETERDLTILRDLGIRYAQGYHLGRPAFPAT